MRGCRLRVRRILARIIPFLFISLIGCTSTHRVAEQDGAPARDTLESFAQREMLSHFIDGAIYDLKEAYANAILEYQDALQFGTDPALYAAISADYSKLGKHALASKYGHLAVAIDSLNKNYHFNLANIYLAAFQVDSAIKEYEAILRIDSSDVQALYSLARLYETRKPLEAIKLYQRLLAIQGSSWEVCFRLAQLYNKLQQRREEADMLQAMLRIDPGNSVLRRSLADTYVELKQYDNALNVLEEILQTTPNEIDVLGRMAEIELLKGNFTRARIYFDRLLAQDSLSTEARVHIGEVFLNQAQKDSTIFPAARSVFLSLQKSHPNDWRPYWYLGAIALLMREDSIALVNFLRVTELKPENAEAWSYVGSIELDLNKTREAITALRRADSLKPNTFRTLFLLGAAYSRAQENSQAAEILEKALSIDSTNVDAWGLLGLVYDSLHDTIKSDKAYEHALRIDPHNHLVLNNYSYSLAERGVSLERALEMAHEAVAAQPDNTSYLDTLGWVYYKLGNYEEARKYISRAIEKGDASPTVIAHMGDVFLRLNDHAKAVEFWKKALALDPNNQSLKEKLEQAEKHK